MKILIITPRLAITGVPLAQLRLSRALLSRGHSVTIIFGKSDPSVSIPTDLAPFIRVLGLTKVRQMLGPMIKYLRCENPDVVFSAEDHLNIIVLLAAILSGSPAKISVSSRVNPYDTYSGSIFSKKWILKKLFEVTMHRASVLSCVSIDMVSQYKKIFKNSRHVCIYNIIDRINSDVSSVKSFTHPWLLDKDAPVLVAAGQLQPWKGFSYLIRAVDFLKSRRSIKLLILGEGPLRQELQNLISAYNLNDCVQLIGAVENPLDYFYLADVFVLSSLVEGLPNVLVEAMLCGCTPVATDCPTGPREVLQNGKYGYLVPARDHVSLALGIEAALTKPISPNLLKEALLPFREDAVVSKHFETLGLCAP